MTAHKVVIIECDAEECDATAPAPGIIVSDLIHMAVPAPDGIVSARHAAAAKGWTHTARGKDLCPNHGPDKPVGKARLLAHIPHPHLHWGS